MKCQVFKPSRMPLPFGKLLRNSMHAYTAAMSSSITQCSAMERPPYRVGLLRRLMRDSPG